MLKLEHLVENFDLARFALDDYDHDPERLDESLGWFRISSNAVYPFFGRQGLNFLRLCPAEEKPLSTVEAEIEFIDYLIGCGFRAMRPIAGHAGRKCREIDTPWGKYCVSAFRGVGGKSMEDVELTEAILYAYGKTLGQLHRLSMDFNPAQRRSTFENIAGQMQPLLPETLQPVLRDVILQLNAIPRTRENFGLVHYDFEPDNVFYDEESGKISVIDFDDCIYHFYALDVEQCLESLKELLSAGGFQKARALFLSGYRSEHVLPQEMEEKLALMRQFIDLRAYARLTHCLDSEPGVRYPWMDELTERLQKKRDWLKKKLLNGQNYQ